MYLDSYASDSSSRPSVLRKKDNPSKSVKSVVAWHVDAVLLVKEHYSDSLGG